MIFTIGNRPLNGVKEIIEVSKKKQPYFVIFYDFKKEANAIRNSLGLYAQKKIRKVLKLMNKKNNMNSSRPNISFFSFKKQKNTKKLHLILVLKE